METLETSGRAGIALVVTLVLLAATWLVWRRRGSASGLRWLGVSLLPVAAWLTGTLGLVVEIAGDVTRYVARLVFSPVVWAGVGVLVVAVLLFAVGTAMRDRGIGVRGRRDLSEASVGGRPAESASPSPARRPERGGGRSKDADAGLDDDVSDILRKHGIS